MMRRIIGPLFLSTSAVIWGGVYLVAQDALTKIDGYYIALLRYGCGALLLTLLLILFESPKALKLENKGLTVFLRGAIGNSGFGICLFLGLTYSTPLHGAILIALTPLITVLTKWIFNHERPHKVTLICIFFAFVGVFLVVTDGNFFAVFSGKDTTLFGDVLFMLGSFCWVYYTLGGAQVPNWSSLRYTAVALLFSIPTLLLAILVTSWLQISHPPSLATLLSFKFELFYLIVLATVLGVLLWNSGIKRMGVVNGMLFNNLIPISTFVMELIQGRHFPLVEYIGAFLTIGSLVANSFYARKKSK